MAGGGEDFYRLIKQAYDGSDRAQQPTVRPNRTLLAFTNASEAVALQEALTVQATAQNWPARWGPSATHGATWGRAGKWAG